MADGCAKPVAQSLAIRQFDEKQGGIAMIGIRERVGEHGTKPMILQVMKLFRRELLPKNQTIVLSVASILVVSPVLFGEVSVSPRYPVVFQEYSPGISTDVYESCRLQMNLKEKPDAPMAFEAEHASRITLHGAERLGFMNDASAGVAVQQAMAYDFNFETLAPATYFVWFRCKAHPGNSEVAGPLGYGVNVDNGETLVNPRITAVSQACGPDGWAWVKVAEQKLNAGIHHMSVSANLVLYGAVVDRVVYAKDPAFSPVGKDIGPAETASVAVESGFAVSGVINPAGIKQWRKISCRQALCGGRVNWAYKLEGTDDWKDTREDDLSAIPPEKAFRLRMTLIASADKKTPFVDTVRLEYAGAPLQKELVSGVLFESRPDGGCVVSAGLYRVVFAANGRIESLAANGRELMVTGSEGKTGLWEQFTRYPGGEIVPVPLGAPELTADNRIACRTDETTQLFEFKRNGITILLSSFGGKALDGRGSLAHVFQLNPRLDIARIVEEGTGKTVPAGTSASNTPRIVFKDDSSVTINPVSVHLPAAINYSADKGFVVWGDNRENFNTIGLTFTAKPGASPLLSGNVACEPEDHNFLAGQPVRITTSSMIPFDAASFKGEATLTLTEQYVPPRRKPEVFEKTIPLDVSAEGARKPITWEATLKSPGHYRGEYRLTQNAKVVNRTGFSILYGADTDKAQDKPLDYNVFWKTAMDKLATMPPTFERLSERENNGFILSRITFRTIDNRDAWGNMAEPKAAGKYPAVLHLPAVFSGAGASEIAGFVTLGCEVYGFDPTKLDILSNEARAIYQPWQNWQNRPVSKPEEFWLYYAYCTIARAYDVLANCPKVDKDRIYITGVSQGGGLTIAAAGLRPQNAGAVSIVPGICRIAWASPAEGGGAWGPTFQEGPDYAEMARMAQYFETAYLVPNIRSRFVMFVGLFDKNTPPFAAATVFSQTSKTMRERTLIVDPWSAHAGRSDLSTYIARWAEEDRKGPAD